MQIDSFHHHALRLGTAGITLLSTGLSLLASVLITVAAMKLWRPDFPLTLPIRIAVLSPILIAPPITYFVVQFLRRIHQLEQEKGQVVAKLDRAMSEVKALSGMLPICASCKKIRDDRGNWHQLEVYIKCHSEADFSHDICPDCAMNLYPDGHRRGDERITSGG